MSRLEPSLESQLARLRTHLREERYSRWATWNYVSAARRFLRALERRGQALESVSAADVERYLDGLKRQRDRRALPAPWRRQHQAAIHMLLRLAHGKWPPEVAPTTVDEIAMHEVIRDYDAWMVELRGLSASTRERARTEARSLLRWLHDRGKGVATLSVADLDVYVAWRGSSMRRTSKALMASTLRGVLRYLHGSGRMPVNLADAIEGPPIYAIVFFDCLRIKICDEGAVKNKAVYLAIGVRCSGHKEVLGIWIE
jgi:site-specific recombinase XerD